MTLIEGVGDEVTIFVGLLVLLVVLTLAWISTGVTDRPFQFLSRLRGRGRRIISNSLGTEPEPEPAAASNEPASTSAENVTATVAEEEGQEEEEVSPTSTPGSENFVHVSPRENQEDAIPAPEESDQSVLRQRRLNFYNRETTPGRPEDASRPEETPQANESNRDTQGHDDPVEEETDFTPLEGHIRIRLKYLDDRQRWVQAKPEDTIGHFKRTHFSSEMSGNTIVRIIFNGRELSRENASLASYNVADESVVHCLISQAAPPNPQALNRSQPFDIGSLMFPLFGLILALLWYSRFSYKQFFNTMSTLTLVGISFLFLVALFASFRNNEVHEAEAN